MKHKQQRAVSEVQPATAFLNNPVIPVGLILAVCLIAYANTFHVPFQFDDPRSITEVPFVRDLHRFPNFFFQSRAIGFLSFGMNYALHGSDVVGYHVVNLAIHAVNSLLVYALVVLTGQTPLLGGLRQRPRARTIALFTALLFAGHPVQTQAVTYIAQRFASLAALFFLLSLVAYIRFRLTGASRTALLWYLLSLVAAVLAMKTKEIAFTLPLSISLYEFLFFGGELRRRILQLLPLLLTMVVIPLGLMGIATPLSQIVADAAAVTRVQTDITRWEYLLTQFTVIVTYLRLLLIPVNQNLDYDYPVARSLFEPNVFLSLLLLLALAATALYLLVRYRGRPGPHRMIAFGIFWFFLTLSVESSVIPIADVIFEHRMYLPSVGFLLVVTTALFWARDTFQKQFPALTKAVPALLASIVFILTIAAYERNSVWASEFSLWEDVIQKSPGKARGYNGLGLAYYNSGDYQSAVAAFSRAVAMHPRYGVAFNNLGNAYYRQGLYEQAVNAQTEAIALDPKNATFLNNRGLALAAGGAFDQAISDYSQALELEPSSSEVHHNLGFVLHCKGRYREAIAEYSKSLAAGGPNAAVFSNKALSESALGNLQAAHEDYEKAISLDPLLDAAYSGRGALYGQEGLFDLAASDFSRAISLNPGNVGYYTNRAIAEERAGHAARAAADFESACEMGDQHACGRVSAMKSLRKKISMK